jgi:DNA polymerase III epsilon subunit-like protein
LEAIFDIEANGLENPTKIWCLSVYYKNSKGEDCFHSTTDYNQMRGFFSKAEVLIGHNIIRWDIPHIERILGIEINPKLVIDTLTLSWYLYPNRNTHGLEAYGEELGVKKPPIENWDDEDMLQEYIHRCEEDVQINKRVLEKQIGHLKEIYGEDTKRILGYLAFKTKCARLQEESRWKLDVDRVKRGLKELEEELENKTTEVAKAMPKVPTKRKMSYPARPRKKDGSLSVTGQNWYSALEDLGLPEDHLEDIEIVTGFKDPNPGSHQQVKDWLFGLGWEPETFKYVKEEDGERKIPQIKQEFSVDLCPSIKKLQEKEPAIEHLEGIGVIKHRIGILKGFLRDMTDDGHLSARVAGLTNTLRFIHSELVNLPAASAPYAKDIRGSLIAPEGYELLGSDMSSLEDRTKQHYMWPHDPEYVKEMMVDDFDPHLALAEFAGALTPEQVRAHKEGRENHKATRHIYKTANYACTYGAGGPTVARGAGISVKEGKAVVDAYRKKNWAIDVIANEQKVIHTSTGMWLYNPVSRLYYSLRYEKDIFSTLNQGTGVYCFDTWIAYILSKREQLTGQFHDEIILTVKKGEREEVTQILKEAIEKVNDTLNLNRELDIDIQFGDNYGEIH